ncbi:flavin monoamine oxidase family protein [Tenacibaculum aiptasiae]|uniref:flavin monoamine oxidase family protein n=1 Tax=Tenacibaculum aiptasiae TaxID=426481 RepID=UPI00232E4461|nr:FAD-dependent oxidoreductase [Tenacibaculum aiptasiae]
MNSIIAIILATTSLFSFNKEKDTLKNKEKKVIIIGAGISGLAAAKYFKEKGINPIVLEAQNKVGGRLKTDRSLGIAFDEGASWIHGPKGNPITTIAKLSKATTFLTDDDNVEVYNIDGTKYQAKFLKRQERKYKRKINRIRGKKNQSFGQRFYKKFPKYIDNNLWTYMLSAYLEFDTGGDIYKLSSTYFYDDEAFGGDDLIITNGYDNLTNYLAEGIDIRLNNNVTHINYANNTVLITTNENTYEADFVLVTVPLGVLKNKNITFIPLLPKKTQKAIEGLEMGSVNKFLLTWEKPFWNTDLQYIGYTPKKRGKFNYFINMNKFAPINALMTFSFGEFSKKTEYMSDEEVTQEIMTNLRAIYGPNIPNPTNILRTKWNTNKYAFGSYSFGTNGTTPEYFEAFEESINNKIFFAGEHTIVDYRGTVHGAYLSGIREAKKIIKLFTLNR